MKSIMFISTMMFSLIPLCSMKEVSAVSTSRDKPQVKVYLTVFPLNGPIFEGVPYLVVSIAIIWLTLYEKIG